MSDEETLGEKLQRVIGAAIESAIAEHEGGFTTKWVALVETVDAEGARGLWPMASDEVKAWDTVGLLQHGLHLQQAATLADQLRPDD